MTEAELTTRLERLESDNRRLKRLAVAALALGLALGTIYATRPVPDVIKAHRFEAVNSAGMPQVFVEGQNDQGQGPAIKLSNHYAPGGMADVFIIDPRSNGPMIGLNHNERGTDASLEQIFLGYPLGQPSLMVNAGHGKSGSVAVGLKDGSPNIFLMNDRGNGYVRLFVSPSGKPQAELSDSQGFRMDLGSAGELSPRTGASTFTSADSIIMWGNSKDHHVIWQAP